VAVDPKRGRFGRRDSIPVTSTNNADAGFDFSQDGRTVVMASSEQGTFDLWAAERRDTAFVPVRRLQRSSMRPGRRGYISPDGKNVLYNLPQGSVAGSSSFRTVAFDGGPERVIMTLSTPWSGFVAGLDGRFLYIGERSESGGTRVMAYPIAGGPSLPVVELPDSGHHLVAGPGGGVGVINRAGDSLRFYAATGALLRVLSLPRTTGLTQLIPSPDGNAFAFPGNEVQMGEDGDFEQEFLRLDAVTGDVRPLVRVGYLSYFVGLAGWNAEGLVLGLFRNGEPEFSLFSVPFDGGPPVRLASLPFGGRAGCTLSADITRMACLVSHPVTDLHLIRDFDGLR